uniref:Uncharacterized protein n=1 Tax=Timema cristinae TaxID=61476 RepID=A0A7R9C9Y4_TIMCR|nr:unnamed protein product [Timema cristinae]
MKLRPVACCCRQWGQLPVTGTPLHHLLALSSLPHLQLEAYLLRHREGSGFKHLTVNGQRDLQYLISGGRSCKLSVTWSLAPPTSYAYNGIQVYPPVAYFPQPRPGISPSKHQPYNGLVAFDLEQCRWPGDTVAESDSHLFSPPSNSIRCLTSKNNLSNMDRDWNPDIHVVGSPVYCESEAFNHEAINVGWKTNHNIRQQQMPTSMFVQAVCNDATVSSISVMESAYTADCKQAGMGVGERYPYSYNGTILPPPVFFKTEEMVAHSSSQVACVSSCQESSYKICRVTPPLVPNEVRLVHNNIKNNKRHTTIAEEPIG